MADLGSTFYEFVNHWFPWAETTLLQGFSMLDYTLDDALARFDLSVNRGRGGHACWEWTGPLNAKGYGYFRSDAGATTRLAHRWHWIARVGPLTRELVLDHICRNRCCVRLDHLRPLSTSANILAGEGPSARNARKVVCAKGHPLQPMPKVLRRCPVCRRETLRKAQQRARDAQSRADELALAAEWARLPNLGGYREPDPVATPSKPGEKPTSTTEPPSQDAAQAPVEPL